MAPIPPIRGYKTADGRYLFFLPDLMDPYHGRSLVEDDFVIAFLERQQMLPRCADPRCNLEFAPKRDDQLYCTGACNHRHRARQAYRLANGLPEDAPVTAPPAELERRLRAALALARKQVDLRPSLVSERLPDGTSRMMGRSRQLQEARMRLDETSRFLFDLKTAGFVYNDFDRDAINELVDLYKANGCNLPAHEVVDAKHDRMRRMCRVTDEAIAEELRVLAQQRCASLFPDMDRIRADGSVGPTAEPSKGEA